MDSIDALVTLGRVTAGQWGLVTEEQASQLEVHADQLAALQRAEILAAVAPGVYHVAAAPLPAQLDIKVAWLQLCPGRSAWSRLTDGRAVISHATACTLHELGETPTGPIEVLVGADVAEAPAGVRLHRTAGVDPADITLVDGLPVTTVVRTIADLAAAGTDGGHLGQVAGDALRRGLVTPAALAVRLGPFAASYGLAATAPGRTVVEYLLAQAGETAPSQT